MRALVLGSGVSGKAAARLLRRAGHEAAIYDVAPATVAELRDEEFEVHSGSWTNRLLKRVDLVVTSPGLKPSVPPLSEIKGVPVVAEVELAARHLGGTRLAAVTGTNGKSTVTELTATILTSSGLNAVAAGNIGLALSDVVLTAEHRHDIAVVEVSSFQLHFIEQFHPEVAVILNIAPDHLDWHGSFSAYAAAKARIFENQGSGDLVVFDEEDAGASAVASRAPGRLIRVGGSRRSDDGFGPEGGKLWIGSVAVDIPDWAVGDRSFLADFAAAGAAATELGASAQGIADGIEGFKPGPHRRTLVGEWGGVAWVDDSKATNPHAAAAAADAYRSVVLIAGGRDKGLDLAPIIGLPTVRHMVAIGEATPFLSAAVAPGLLTKAASLEEAIAVADRIAEPGDTVLLSPGCASFDMFDNYQHRGREFAAAVARLKGA